MATKQQAIDRFLLHFSDCDSTLATALFDEAHAEILGELDARNFTITVPLTAGVREYALDAGVTKVWEAYYQESSDSGSWVKLVPTSIPQLADEGAWRSNAQTQRPAQFYLSTTPDGNSATRVVGFDHLPPVTSSGGYPNVTLYCTSVATLDDSDAIPEYVSDYLAYVYLMCFRFAVIRRPEVARTYYDLYSGQLDKCKDFAKGLQFENEGVFLRPQFFFSSSV